MAAILLEYTEKKQERALLLKDAKDIADRLEGLAKVLKSDPTRIDNPNPPPLPLSKEIYELARKIHDPEMKLAELHSTAIQAGLPVD